MKPRCALLFAVLLNVLMGCPSMGTRIVRVHQQVSLSEQVSEECIMRTLAAAPGQRWGNARKSGRWWVVDTTPAFGGDLGFGQRVSVDQESLGKGFVLSISVEARPKKGSLSRSQWEQGEKLTREIAQALIDGCVSRESLRGLKCSHDDEDGDLPCLLY
jgi:hypothetical protein